MSNSKVINTIRLIKNGLTKVENQQDLEDKISNLVKEQNASQFVYIEDKGMSYCNNPHAGYYVAKTYSYLTLFGEPVTSLLDVLKQLTPEQINQIADERHFSSSYDRSGFDATRLRVLYEGITKVDCLLTDYMIRGNRLNPFEKIYVFYGSFCASPALKQDHLSEVTFQSVPLEVKENYWSEPANPDVVFLAPANLDSIRVENLAQELTQLLFLYKEREQNNVLRELLIDAKERANVLTNKYEINSCSQEQVKNPGPTEKLFILSKDKIKTLRKNENFEVNRFSNSRNDAKGLLVANPVKSKSYAKFWFFNEKPIDGYNHQTLLREFRTYIYALRLKRTVEYKDIWAIKPDDISKVSFSVPKNSIVQHIYLSSLQEYSYIRTDTVFPGQLCDANFSNIIGLEVLVRLLECVTDPVVTSFLFSIGKTKTKLFLDSLIDLTIKQVFNKLMEAYNGSIGGKLDEAVVKKTKFNNFYGQLTPVQMVKLRQYINSGDVNEDVLNNHPLTVYLLLSTGSSLKNLNKKKTKIFDSMKTNAPIPKWFLNNLLDADLVIEDNNWNTEGNLAIAKYCYRTIKFHWGNTDRFMWMLDEDPKIFSQMDYKQMQKLIMWDMTLSNMTGNGFPISTSYLLNDHHQFPPDLNRGLLNKIYKEYSEEKNLDQREEKRREIVIKNFFGDFQQFWNIFSETLPYNSESYQPPQGTGFEYYSYEYRQLNRNTNDFFCYATFLFCYLTESNPYDNFEMFVCYISQILQWVKEAKERHQYRLDRDLIRNDFRPIEDTEEYIRDRINLLELSYEIPPRYMYNRARPGVNPNTEAEIQAYQNMLSLLGTFIFEAGAIGAARRQDGHKVTDTDLMAIQFTTIDGLTIENPEMGFRAIQITNAYDLKEEGSRMNHCVAMYRNYCQEGTRTIVHIEPIQTGGPKTLESTMELRFLPLEGNANYGETWNNQYNQRVRNYQHRSHRNGNPHQDTIRFADWLVKKWNATIVNEKYLLFTRLMTFFDDLAKANDGKTLKQQLAADKVPIKKPKAAKESVEEQNKTNKPVVRLTANTSLLKNINKAEVQPVQIIEVPIAEPDPGDIVEVQAV